MVEVDASSKSESFFSRLSGCSFLSFGDVTFRFDGGFVDSKLRVVCFFFPPEKNDSELFDFHLFIFFAFLLCLPFEFLRELSVVPSAWFSCSLCEFTVSNLRNDFTFFKSSGDLLLSGFKQLSISS